MTARTRAGMVALGTVLAVLASACTGIFGDGPPELEVRFASSFNLFEGSDVRVAGVVVGQVSKIDVPAGDDTVRVTLQLTKPDVQLPRDVRAVVIPHALLGERYVQLDPPYTGGPAFDLSEPLPAERTAVPDDFDEVLDSLNDYLQALPEDEVARLVTNLATVLDGNGEELGQTLENAEVLIDVLRENDDEIVSLARQLADLNESLATRDEQIGAFIEDFNTVSASLADDREEIDAAVDGLVRMTEELASLLGQHRGNLEEDLGTLTHVGRTAVRNLDQIDRFLFWSAELYRHAERVVDREHNWLPLVQHFDDIAPLIADRIGDRLVGLCLRLGLPDCETVDDDLPAMMCLDPLLPCENAARPEETVPVADALADVLEDQPELRRRLEEEGRDLEEEIGDLDVDGGVDDGETSGDDGSGEDPDQQDGGLDDLLPGLMLRGVVR